MKPIKPGELAENEDLKKDLVDDRTRKKIKKHITDIHDVITDEDIKNANLLPGKKSPRKKTETPKKKKQNTAEPPVDDNKEDSSLTSWNILES